jgi:hypothetical protein
MKHETNIDTVAVQMDFEKAEEQRRKLSLLCQWVTIRELGKLEQDKSLKFIIKYDVYFGGKIIFTIHSGFSKKADSLTGESEGFYYIRIRFAGLKSHKQRQDEASFNALMTICAFLNTTRSKFRMVELDVSIDAYCNFDNILAICVKKSGNTTYNQIGHKQYYKGIPTTYIEKYINSNEADNAVVRSYLYDKSVKEGLIGSITRFELKLQNRFFLQYGFNAQSIINAMNKYYVMYFESAEQKSQYCSVLKNFRITQDEIEIFGLNRFRLYLDGNVIKEFIRQIESVYVGFYGDIVVPVVNYRLSEKKL